MNSVTQRFVYREFTFYVIFIRFSICQLNMRQVYTTTPKIKHVATYFKRQERQYKLEFIKYYASFEVFAAV